MRFLIWPALLSAICLTPAGVHAQRPMGAWFGFSISCSQCGFTTYDAQGGRRSRVYFSFSSAPVIRQVEPGGPAARAGLRAGDKLTAIDGRPFSSREGGTRFAQVTPGTPVTLEYDRDGELGSTVVTVTGFPTTASSTGPTGVGADQTDDTVAPPSPGPLRYSGTFAGVQIEVHGAPDIQVRIPNNDCWMVIVTAGATIRVQNPNGCSTRR